MRSLPLILFLGLAAACSGAPLDVVPDSAIPGADAMVGGTRVISWSCSSDCDVPGDKRTCAARCWVPGSPYTSQNRFDFDGQEFRAWRTSYPTGGITGTATCSDGHCTGRAWLPDGNVAAWTWTDGPLVGCVTWYGLPRDDDDPADRWCFDEGPISQSE